MTTAITPAKVHDTEAADELLQGVQCRDLVKRNYWKPDWHLDLKERNLIPLAPVK